jgi:hypothetical protein
MVGESILHDESQIGTAPPCCGGSSSIQIMAWAPQNGQRSDGAGSTVATAVGVAAWLAGVLTPKH